jgi:hypothetical protein
MTPNTQPLPALPAASPAPPRDKEFNRLLRIWADLAARAVAAAAHGSEDEQSLRRLQEQIEDALLDRELLDQTQLDSLLAWESTLLHTEPQALPEDCLICRKGRLGLPPGLPLPATRGGGR